MTISLEEFSRGEVQCVWSGCSDQATLLINGRPWCVEHLLVEEPAAATTILSHLVERTAQLKVEVAFLHRAYHRQQRRLDGLESFMGQSDPAGGN